MIGTVFRSEDVPAEDRFDYWRELVGRTHAPSDMSSDYTTDFWAEQRLLELGPVTVWPASFRPMRFHRDARMVRRSDPELYHLSLVLGGGLGVDHAGRTDTHGPQDLYVIDTSQPYDVRPPADQDRRVVTGVGVEFPKVLLPASPDRVRELLGRRLSGQDGVGAVLTGFLTGLSRQADSLQPSDAPRLGTALLDLLLAWFAHVLDTEAALPPETRDRALTVRIRAFVRQNLHDPELTPPVIAAAHHISLSYLHRLFQDQTRDETVAAWIRNQRLEGARRDLADPALRATPVHTIAARWGLHRPAHFSRAFRTAYGLSPTEYRLQAATPTAPQGTVNGPEAGGPCGSCAERELRSRHRYGSRERPEMLAEAMTAAAAAAGTTVVQSASSDLWTAFRERCARLVGRGDPARENDALERLDQTAAVLDAAGEEESGRVRDLQVGLWQGRFESLLESLEQPERERLVAELRALAEESAPEQAGRGVVSGNTFHGPTAVQVGDHNHQDVHFGSTGSTG